jgi:hypothetical protein
MKVIHQSFKFHFNTVFQHANFFDQVKSSPQVFLQISQCTTKSPLVLHELITRPFLTLLSQQIFMNLFIAMLVRGKSFSTPYCFQIGIYF